ncbi:hypothetical protein VIGAN_02211200, partial [Vigna angularis var. angularis]
HQCVRAPSPSFHQCVRAPSAVLRQFDVYVFARFFIALPFSTVALWTATLTDFSSFYLNYRTHNPVPSIL